MAELSAAVTETASIAKYGERVIRFSPAIVSRYQRRSPRLVVGNFGVVIVTLSALSSDSFHTNGMSLERHWLRRGPR